jgi:predicted nucleic-acid-binding protein
VIGLDTNILARYYIQVEGDAEGQTQREAARRLMESGEPLMVCKTALLELEWVMRGVYEFSPRQIAEVLTHLLALPHMTVEDRDGVCQAIANTGAGLDMADALHHASYRGCDSIASFDDRRFGRRARRLGLSPRVIVPQRISRPGT